MFYKTIFSEEIPFDLLNQIDDDNGRAVVSELNAYTGMESVEYNGGRIDLALNDEGNIEALIICNECVKSYNIENSLLSLTGKLMRLSGVSAELIDGRGFSELVDSENIEEYL